jgi:hypothetical protein
MFELKYGVECRSKCCENGGIELGGIPVDIEVEVQ